MIRRALARVADLRAVRAPRNRLERARRVPWPEGAPPSDRVAIVVVSYQTRALTAQLLFSLYRVLGADQFARVVVVDNASTDGSRELLEALAEAGLVTLLANRRQRYHGPGLNQAISWLARHDPVGHVLVLDSDVVVLRRELVRDGVAALRASGAALAGQKVPGSGSELVPLACLLLDPRRAWTRDLPPFLDDGAPSRALQEAVLARGLGIAGFDVGLGSYALHLGGGTLARIAADENAANRFYGWARGHHPTPYSRHPLGRELHERFLALYAREVGDDAPGSLVAACRRGELLRIPLARPLPPVEELAALSARGVDLPAYLLERFAPG